MKGYWVEIRGLARQEVLVRAESKAEAREKAAQRDFETTADYPDFEYGGDLWATRKPVEDE